MKVLTVDDSRAQLMMINKFIIDVIPDAQVISYNDPAKALEDIKANKHSFSFSLIDYNMNNMSGIELAEKLLQEDFTPIDPSKTVLLSANIQQAVQDKATSLGLTFIGKPLSVEKLREFLKLKGILA